MVAWTRGLDARSGSIAHKNQLVHLNHGVNSSVNLRLESSINIGARLVALGGRNGQGSIHLPRILNSAIDRRGRSSIHI